MESRESVWYSSMGKYAKFLYVLGMIAGAEYGVMQVMPLLGIAPHETFEGVVDVLLLLILVSPIVYLFVKTDEALHRSESSLFEEKNKVEAILASMGDGVTMQDRDMKVVYQNPALKRLIGDRVGENCYKAYEKSDDICESCPVAETFRDGGVHTSERTVNVEGRVVHVENTSSPLRDGEGNITGAVEVVRDITARKEAEAELTRTKEALETVFNASPAAVIAVDLEDKVTIWNPAAERIFGWHKEDVLGKLIPTIPEDRQGEYRGFVQRILQGEYIYCEDIKRIRKDGTLVDLSLSAAPLHNPQGAIYGAMAVFTDLTIIKRAEEELKARERQHAAVARLGQLALEGVGLDKLFDAAVYLVSESLDVELCKVLELLPDGNSLLLQAGVGWKEGLVGRAEVSAGVDSQAGYTLLSDSPVVVEDLRAETRFNGPPLLLDHGVISGMSVVIKGLERPWGVLGAHTTRRRGFCKEDVNFLQSVAHVLAEAIERARVEEKVRDRNERLAMLNRIDRAMNSTLEITGVLEVLMENLTRAVGMESGAFYMYDPKTDRLVVEKCYNYGKAEEGPCIFPSTLPGMDKVAADKEPVIISRVETESGLHKAFGITSFLLLPLSKTGRLLGVICLFNTSGPHEFTEGEVTFARQVADQAVIAIENARLVQSLMEGEANLTQKNRELAALNAVAEVIAMEQDMDTMLQLVLEKTLSLSFLDIERKGVIFLVDETDPEALDMAAQVGLLPEILASEKRISMGHCLCGRAALTGEVVRSTDCFTDPHHTFRPSGMKGHGHVVIPIKAKGRVQGVMTFYLEPDTVATEAEERVLASVANQLAVAIENRRLLRHLEKASEEWLETFDAMEELVTIHSPDFTILRANKAAADAAGMDVHELVGRKCFDVFHGTEGRIPMCPAAALLEGKETGFSYDVPIGGSTYEISVYPLREDGRLSAFVHIAKDISERKAAEAALRESESKFRSIVEQSLVGVYIIQDGRFRYVNPRFAEIFEYTQDEMVSSLTIRDVVLPEDWPIVEENIRRRVEGEVKAVHYSFRCKTKPGRVITIEIHGSGSDYEGRPAVIGVMMDISERLMAQDELVRRTQQMAILKEASRQLEEINRLKSEFLANMSHELRTPLNAVIGLSQVLMEGTYGSVNAKQSEYLGGINQSGQHLLSLINEILDLSKIEAGKERLELAEFNMANVLKNAFIMVKERAMKHNIELAAEVGPEVGNFVADERRVKQILFNLLSNAIKFTRPGGKVGLRAGLDGSWFTITVWDTGIGIPEDKQHMLFQPFQMLDSSLSKMHEGTGLGLVLTKKLTEMHGGTITFESKEGEGTAFTVRLPVLKRQGPAPWEPGPASGPDQAQPEGVCAGGNKVMVVEDNPLNMLLAADYLRANGCEVVEAVDGESALDKIGLEAPDLILLDIQMPGIDGFEVMKRLRHSPSTAGIPVIAMTALAMKGDEERCLQSGFVDYISKPVDLNEMITKVRMYITEGGGE